MKKREDPSAIVYDEILKNLGTNIRADFRKTVYNKENQQYTIPLHAFIPNELKPIGISDKKPNRNETDHIFNFFDIFMIHFACRIQIKTNFVLNNWNTFPNKL